MNYEQDANFGGSDNITYLSMGIKQFMINFKTKE
jgi:hypothetical protein